MRKQRSLSTLAQKAVFVFVWLAVAGATHGGVIVNESVGWELAWFIPCANDGSGEVVLFEGRMHVLMTETVDENGGLHTTFHFQDQGTRGEGQTTGDSYKSTGVTRQTMNVAGAGLPAEYTFVNNFRLIGPGPGNNWLGHQTIHVTINVDGETTASVFNSKVECK